MPETPENEGFTFRDRRRAATESTPAPAEEPTIVVHDKRTSAQGTPAPPPVAPAAPVFTPPAPAAAAPPVFGAAPPPPGFGSAPEPPAYAGFGEPGMGDAAGMPGPGEESGLPDIRDYLVEFLMMVRSLAAIRLGLVANPETGRPDVDLEQARIAIDTVAFLIEQLEPSLPAQERLPLRAMVSEMRNHYVALYREATGG
ncbi:MAG: DUF1844 domain-containing protein [Armatimonadota bacterium]